MKTFNQYISESVDKKEVSREFIKGLLLNTYDKLAKEILNRFLKKEGEKMIQLSERESNLLNLIKTYGKISPDQFGSKN
jgi:hypothetical protein